MLLRLELLSLVRECPRREVEAGYSEVGGFV